MEKLWNQLAEESQTAELTPEQVSLWKELDKDYEPGANERKQAPVLAKYQEMFQETATDHGFEVRRPLCTPVLQTPPLGRPRCKTSRCKRRRL